MWLGGEHSVAWHLYVGGFYLGLAHSLSASGCTEQVSQMQRWEERKSRTGRSGMGWSWEGAWFVAQACTYPLKGDIPGTRVDFLKQINSDLLWYWLGRPIVAAGVYPGQENKMPPYLKETSSSWNSLGRCNIACANAAASLNGNFVKNVPKVYETLILWVEI